MDDIIISCFRCKSKNIIVAYTTENIGVPHFKCRECNHGWRIDHEGNVIDAENNDDTRGKAPDEEIIVENDNWKHRSKGMNCATCMWFAEKVTEPPSVGAENSFGRCRKHAPTMSGYPAVFGTDWCGDHKLDENKR